MGNTINSNKNKKNNNSNNLTFFSSGNLPQQYNDIYVGLPKVDEICGTEDWIKFGKKNDFPDELNQLYDSASGLHKNLINKQIELTCGNGWNPIESLQKFLSNPYGKETLDELTIKAAKDLILQGWYALKVYWTNDGKQIAALQYIPVEKVRCQKPPKENYDGEENEDVIAYYISRNWKNVRNNTPYLIPEFNQKFASEQPEQLLVVKNTLNSLEYYALPKYSPILNWLRIDYKISEYHLNGLNNNLMLGSIVYVPDNSSLTEIQKQTIADGIDEKYSNAKNAHKTMVVFYKDKDNKPEVQPLTLPNTDQRFKELMLIVDQKIMVGHGATPLVAANQISGKLGGQQDIENEYQYFQSTVIQFYQRNLERTFNKLKDINGYTDKLVLNKFMIFEQNSNLTAQPQQQVNNSFEKLDETLSKIEERFLNKY